MLIFRLNALQDDKFHLIISKSHVNISDDLAPNWWLTIFWDFIKVNECFCQYDLNLRQTSPPFDNATCEGSALRISLLFLLTVSLSECFCLMAPNKTLSKTPG